MADREGNRIQAGGGKRLAVVRYGREEMVQHERAVESDVLPGQPVTLGADANGNAIAADYSAGDPVYVVEEARGRGMDVQTDTGFLANPPEGDGPEIAPLLKPSGGGLNLRVTAPTGSGDVTIEPGTAITPDATDGFVVGDANGVFAVADDNLTIAEGETELVATEVA